MNQLDWVGAPPPENQTARVIRNTRPTIAEEKAVLVLKLGDLINGIPPAIKSGSSVNTVRDWRNARTAAAKVAGNTRSSVQELTAAITNMQRQWKP